VVPQLKFDFGKKSSTPLIVDKTEPSVKINKNYVFKSQQRPPLVADPYTGNHIPENLQQVKRKEPLKMN